MRFKVELFDNSLYRAMGEYGEFSYQKEDTPIEIGGHIIWPSEAPFFITEFKGSDEQWADLPNLLLDDDFLSKIAHENRIVKIKLKSARTERFTQSDMIALNLF